MALSENPGPTWSLNGTTAPEPPRKNGRRRWFAWGALLLLLVLILGGIALLPKRGDGPSGKSVVVFLTDLPGSFERIRLDLAAVTVGGEGEPLTVEQPSVEISDHQGAENALRVASGTVSDAAQADGRVSLVFAGAQGYRDGAWVDLQVPQNRITIEQGLGPEAAQFGSHAVLFDFNLESSLIEREGGVVTFQPLVQNSYYYQSRDSDLLDLDLKVDLADFVKVDIPDQVLDDLAQGIVDRLCERSGLCPRELPPSGVPTSSLPLPSSFSPSLSGSQSPALPAPPPSSGGPSGRRFALSDPDPADGANRLPLAPTLRWKSDARPGEVVSYVAVFEGTVKCDLQADASCPISGLEWGKEYRWHVEAFDASGARTVGPTWRLTTNQLPSPATEPTPADAAAGVNPDSVTLRWSAASDADAQPLRYTVRLALSNPPNTIRCNGTEATQCVVQNLEYDKTYHWRVDVWDGVGTKEGPVWNFRTQEGYQPGPCPPVCLGSD